MTVPHEILPPFHLAGVGVGRQEESLTKDRRNTEEPLGNVLTTISHRQPHREAARPKGTSCSWSQLEAHSAKREEKANKASGPACYPHQANIPSICSHLILLHLPLNSPYHKGHVNVWNCPRFADSALLQTGYKPTQDLLSKCRNPPQSEERFFLEHALDYVS